MAKKKGNKKRNDGNYSYVGKASITITPQSDYEAVVRKDNKARVHRDYKKISHKGSVNRTTIEHFTEVEEITDGAIPKSNKRKSNRSPNLTDKQIMNFFSKATKELGKDSKVDIRLKRAFDIIKSVHGEKKYSSWQVVKKRYYEIKKKISRNKLL